MWTQIVGKVRMELSPFLNHWWHVTLYVTPRGLATSSIPYHGSSFDVTFDFLEHNLFMRASEGTTKVRPLIPRSAAAFYRQKSLRNWTGRLLQLLSLSCTLAHGTLSFN
jgi:hypothetical protein